MMDWNGPVSGGGWLAMTVFMLITWAIVIGVGYAIIRELSRHRGPRER